MMDQWVVRWFFPNVHIRLWIEEILKQFVSLGIPVKDCKSSDCSGISSIYYLATTVYIYIYIYLYPSISIYILSLFLDLHLSIYLAYLISSYLILISQHLLLIYHIDIVYISDLDISFHIFSPLVGGFEPLWKIWTSIGMNIPNIWENKIDVPNHQPAHNLLAAFPFPPALGVDLSPATALASLAPSKGLARGSIAMGNAQKWMVHKGISYWNGWFIMIYNRKIHMKLSILRYPHLEVSQNDGYPKMDGL